jgi:hypothetical protein
MSSHFACIGFPIREVREYHALMHEAAARGHRMPLPGGGTLARWEVGGGPEIWVVIAAEGDVLDATPFFSTGEALRVAVTTHGEDAEEVEAGWVEGWVEPVEPDEPLSGAFPVRIDLVNFPLVRDRLRAGAIVPVEFCGIAHEATLYPDRAAYESVRQVQYQPPMRSFTSVGHFSADPALDEVEATALISGIITEPRLLTNTETGAPFWWLRVDTEKVTVSVLVDRETLPAEPQQGNIVAASCWIVGRVIPTE